MFNICKIIDSMDIFKSLNISIGIEKENREMLKFVPDHLNTKKCAHMQLNIILSIKICS